MAQFAGKLHGESPILCSETETHWITSIRHVIPEYGGFAVSHLFLSTCIIPRGFLGSARLSDYCASKWALLGFAVPWQIKWPSDDSNLHKTSIRFDELRSEFATQESLRLELRAQQCSGVGIMAVCPYLVDTQQFDCRHFLLHSSVCSNFPYSRETEEIRRDEGVLDDVGVRLETTWYRFWVYQTQDVSWCLRGCRSFNLVPEMRRLVEVLLAVSVGRFESTRKPETAASQNVLSLP